MVINTAEVCGGSRRTISTSPASSSSEWTVMRKILFRRCCRRCYRRAPLHRHRRLVIVAAEMHRRAGIGFWIWNEWNNLNVENIIIAIVIIGVVGLLLEQGLMLLARRFSWQKNKEPT